MDDDESSHKFSKQKTSDKPVKRAKSQKSSKSNSYQSSASNVVVESNPVGNNTFGTNQEYFVEAVDVSSSAHLCE